MYCTKFLRTFQTNFPFLLDAKFAAQRAYLNLRQRPFEADFNALALFPPSAGDLFLDVGGNRGQSIDAIQMKTRAGAIQSFEPNPLLFKKLKTRLGGNERVTLNNFGLGNEAGEFSLYIPFYKQWMFDGLASFDKNEASDWLRNRLNNFQERHLTIHEVTCQIKRLDDLELSPTFIKLDVQGYELPALQGGQETIERCLPVFLIEMGSDGIREFLATLGYNAYRFNNGKLIVGGPVTSNEFFLTDDAFDKVEALA